MIGDNFGAFCRNKEEDIILFALDFDIGFISGIQVVDRPLILEIEKMTVIGSGFGIVEHRLIGDRDAEDITQDVGGFSCRNGTGDMEGQYQP